MRTFAKKKQYDRRESTFPAVPVIPGSLPAANVNDSRIITACRYSCDSVCRIKFASFATCAAPPLTSPFTSSACIALTSSAWDVQCNYYFPGGLVTLFASLQLSLEMNVLGQYCPVQAASLVWEPVLS